MMARRNSSINWNQNCQSTKQRPRSGISRARTAGVLDRAAEKSKHTRGANGRHDRRAGRHAGESEDKAHLEIFFVDLLTQFITTGSEDQGRREDRP